MPASDPRPGLRVRVSRAMVAALGAGFLGSCLFARFGEAIARGMERAMEMGWGIIFHASSRWSPDGSRLLVSSWRAGDLWCFPVDGSEPHQLAQGSCLSASFSPDGASIVYSCVEYPSVEGDVRPRAAIWVMNADGTERAQIALSHEGVLFNATWSPDGSWIACEVQEHIDLVRPDRSERRQLGRGSLPVWSPSGALIASVNLDEATESAWIQLMPIDGSPPVHLTPGFSCCWSPDGERLVFMDRPEEGGDTLDSGVFVIDVDGSNRRRLCAGLFPRWSPSGESILVQRSTAELDMQLVVLAQDGSGELLLAREASLGHWSPDGRRVAFQRGSEVFVIEADGSGERSLGSPPVPDRVKP